MSFIDSPLSGLITSNGDYSISVPAGSQIVVEAAGTFDSGTITLGYLTLSGNFKSYQLSGNDVAIADGEAHSVLATGRGEVVLRVANAGASCNIRYLVTPVLRLNE